MDDSKNKSTYLIPGLIRLRDTVKDVIAAVVDAPVLDIYDIRPDLVQTAGMCPRVVSEIVNFWMWMR